MLLVLFFAGLGSVAGTLAEAAGEQEAPAEPMPELIWPNERSEHSRALFVDTEHALLPSGDFDATHLSEGDRIAIEWHSLEEDEGGCSEGARAVAKDNPEETWSDYGSIAKDSDYVVFSRVTGVKQGFQAHSPGTLVRIEPVEWVKGEDSWVSRFIFFPRADIRVGDRRFCVADPRYPRLPQPGWQVLISYTSADARRNSSLLFVAPSRLITIPASGPVSLPLFLRKRQPAWADKPAEDLREAVIDTLAEGESP
ncbi:MAG: hypothetical protein AAGF23_08325 [Acidobacteriota bacterium]